MLKHIFFVILFCTFTVQAKVIEKIVAIINDSIVTLSDINDFKTKVTSGGLVDDALLKMRDPKEIIKSESSIIDHLIDERVIDSEIRRLGMTVTIEKVEQEIRSITSRNGITRDQLKSALDGRGVKFSDYQDFIKTSLERQALIDREISSKIKISDEDISNYYLSQNSGSSGQVFEFRLAHILIKDQVRGGTSPKKRMLSIVNLLDKGQNSFAKIASQYSEDPNFSQGGLLGTFKMGEMTKEIENGIKKLDVGGVSAVIRTGMGYHLIKVLDKKLVSDPILNEKKASIRSKLFAEAFNKQFRSWLDRKRKEAFVRIN